MAWKWGILKILKEALFKFKHFSKLRKDNWHLPWHRSPKIQTEKPQLHISHSFLLKCLLRLMPHRSEWHHSMTVKVSRGAHSFWQPPSCHLLNRVSPHFRITRQPIRAQLASAATAKCEKLEYVCVVCARMCLGSVYVCMTETKTAWLWSSMEPPFVWYLWRMAHPFEEQSAAIDIKLPALKTEGPALPPLFILLLRAAWTGCPVTNAALVPCSYTK